MRPREPGAPEAGPGATGALAVWPPGRGRGRGRGRPSCGPRAGEPGRPVRPGLAVDHVALIVLDGWGLAPDGDGNAIPLADTPVFDELWEKHPHTQLIAMGESVGLPEGQMGNSEVGHLNLGAGAIVPQDLARIDEAVRTARWRERALRAALKDAPRVHLIGLVSDGGVHSSDRHLKALIELAEGDVVVHAFTDGRDTDPDRPSRATCRGRELGRRASPASSVATSRWTATSAGTAPEAYDLLVHGEAEHHAARPRRPRRPPTSAARPTSSSSRTAVGEAAAHPPRRLRDRFNFRPDRMREITLALRDPDFTESTAAARCVERYVTLAEYDEDWAHPVVFPPERPALTIGQVIADKGLRSCTSRRPRSTRT